MKESMHESNKIEDIIKFITLISLAIALIALLKQIAFYSNYEIPITYFLNFTELPLIISSDLLFVIIVYLIPFSIVLFETALNEFSNSSDENDFLFTYNFKLSVRVISALSIIIILILKYLSIINYKLFLLLIDLPAILFLITTLTKFQNIYFLKTKKKLPKHIRYLITFSIASIFAMIAYTSLQLYRIDNGLNNGTTIKTKDSTYTSTDSAYFIGKSSEYIFIHNKFDTTSNVIPLSDIITINFKTKPFTRNN